MWPWSRELFASKKLDYLFSVFADIAIEFNNVKAWKMT